ncbi:MAG: hypothetical protein GF393_04930, partial [Armatimonadia bacterium]|nr:hypothetical protein [Armatimonadia bacterium]
ALLAPACAQTILHVAPDGSNDSAGTEAAPFATLARARDEIRAIRQQGGLADGGARVIIHEGPYLLKEPLALSPEDSGSEGAPVVYAAADGASPVISAGRIIDGLTRQDDGSFAVTIPEAADHGWVFRQLFIDGRRYIHARSPNEGQYHTMGGVPAEDGDGTASDRFAFRTGDLQAWPNISDVEVRLTFSWNAGSFPLKSIDTETNIAILGGPATWPIPKPGWASSPYLVFNHPGACDAPGEWRLDRTTGELRVIPFDGEDIAAAQVIAPVHERLVIAEGSPADGRFVEHVRFEGLSFQHAAWHLPEEGFSVPQAATTLGAALEFHAARDCALIDCEIAHVGRYGAWFGEHCSGNTVQRAHCHDLGAGGVRIGTSNRPQPIERVAHHNTVDNCFIHNGGHIHPGAVGIFVAIARNTTITHNEVSDLRYTGISLGWNWGISRNGTRENLVAYNHVHDVMRVLDDGGGIYSLGLTPGSVIRGNHIHDVARDRTVGHGIYLDGGSSGVLCENNLCHDCGAGGIRQQHGTACLTVLNNISAFNGFGLGIDSERTNIFQYNIVYMDEGDTPFRDIPEWKSYNKIIDYNVYWHTSGEPPHFLGFTWDEWREKEGIEDIWYTPKMDPHSRFADPLFVDAPARDFRLQPDSPAIALGFRQWDLGEAGLYGDPDWTSLPERHPPLPLLPTERDSGRLLVTDDFESTAVGHKPAYAALVEAEAEGAYIEVTGERARSGEHSLKFVDSAEAPVYYHPHMYYRPRLHGDMRLRLTFDLYLEPSAMLWSEWRTTASYAEVGPCIYVTAEGALELNEHRETGVTLPSGQWLHFEITDDLGSYADARWAMTITDEAGEVLFDGEDLECGPDFDRIEWLGFVANGKQPAVFYMDNIMMAEVEE